MDTASRKTAQPIGVAPPIRDAHPIRIVQGAWVLLLALLLAGCGLTVPTDPDGTLDRITGGELRVGASPSAPRVIVDGDDVSGSLTDLVRGFAQERDARIVWTVGSEEDLVRGLEEGRLDLAIGGMTDDSPWSERVSMTRGYPGIGGADSAGVVLLPLGENALQAALEIYLDGQVGS